MGLGLMMDDGVAAVGVLASLLLLPIARFRREAEAAVTLEHLVLACLAKKPEDRPRNAQQLAQSLATIDGMTWGEEEAHRWWRQDHPPQAPTCDAIAL